MWFPILLKTIVCTKFFCFDPKVHFENSKRKITPPYTTTPISWPVQSKIACYVHVEVIFQNEACTYRDNNSQDVKWTTQTAVSVLDATSKNATE